MNVQVYIKGVEGAFEQIELFKDESVTLTQSIQNIKDISKIFTDFTKTFNVPASKINNRILKHFYSADVSSYNLGIKLECKLYLNHQFFRKGKIALEGATMKGNKAHTYKLTFFGDTIKLPDLIGDDTLQSLTYLSYIDFIYNATTVKTYLQDGLDITANGETFTDALVIPLISHTKRLFYDSSADVADTGNLHYGGSQNKGVLFNDLKPAIRVHFLIRAIEDKYKINFDSQFFNPTNSVYYDLYMWMHVNKGKLLVNSADISQAPRIPVKDFQNVSNTEWRRDDRADNGNYVGNDYWQFRDAQEVDRRWTYDINITTQNTNYNVFVYLNGALHNSTALYNVSGNQRLTAYTGGITGTGGAANLNNFNGRFQVFIQSTEDANFEFNISLAESQYTLSSQEGQETVGEWVNIDVTTFSGYATSSDDVVFNGATQVPDINVMDFLTGLFKMFNLTAYIDDNDIINVTPLDTFYANSKNTWNITDYLDTTSSEVSKTTPYKSLKFQYEGLDTFFAKHHKAFFGTDWGTEMYDNESRLEGETYEVSVPFEHHKFERLIDAGTNGITDIQWGWSVDDDLNSYVGMPLMFYPHKITSGTAISFQETESTKESLTNYYIPLNHRLPTTDSQTLHFSLEPSEYAIGVDQTPFTKSLYSEYYDTYVRDTFNARRRLYNFRAYLPLRILLNLTLADRVVIYDTIYKINTLKTNFATGLSTLELINDVSQFKLTINQEELADDVSQPYLTVDTTAVTVDNVPTV